MRKRFLILVFMLALAAPGMAQLMADYALEPRTEFSCVAGKWDFYPMTQEEIIPYILDNCIIFASIIEGCQITYALVEPLPDITDNGCDYTFMRMYHLGYKCGEEDEVHPVRIAENFTVKRANTQNAVFPPISLEFNTFEEGATEFDLPRSSSLEEIVAMHPEIHSSCNLFSQLRMEVTPATLVPESDDGCLVEYHRDYTIYDECMPTSEINDYDIAHISESITLMTTLRVSGHLPFGNYEFDSEPLHKEYKTVMDLKKAGAKIKYSREMSDLSVVAKEVPYHVPNRRKYMYYVVSSSCDYLIDSIPKYFVRKLDETSVVPFTLFYQDVTAEGFEDGILEIYPPELDEGCPDFPLDHDFWYKIKLTNKTTGKEWVRMSPLPEGEELYRFDDLGRGTYHLEIYPLCGSCNFDPNDPVFVKEFDIKARKMSVEVTDGYTLYNGDRYSSYHVDFFFLDENDQHVPFVESDQILALFSDEWKLTKGKIYSPKKKEFDPYEMYNIHMGGFGMYEHMMSHYNMVNGEFSHGMQRMIIAKNETKAVTYTLKKANGDVYKEPITYRVFEEPLICANDPNEIYGPTGYTDPDSTVVQMINGDDGIPYTIQFENDPEFATAAAARVKITCNLDPNADPATFRLGNFGFSNYTFEVPPMANYYNKRINMDTLGYWLDVTAGLQQPQNQAYWIFQTIDPQTGVAPVDSLGFLPVNDTLTGVGEGFVTFNIYSRSGGQIQTGDTISEQADIIFDENEVVPTNVYTNTFDVVAPTSVIVCDTTGAHQARALTIGFDASDDAGGSGVSYVELYANVDLTGYEQVARVHPDSVFVYTLEDGNNFNFMGLAVDNVGNKEPYKPYGELSFNMGTPPYDMILSNNVFEENDLVGTSIGDFTTADDQSTDNFVYALVIGEGSTDNGMFSIDGNTLKTNYDFRCYGTYEYSIRVRTTDLTGCFFDKSFNIYAHETESTVVSDDYRYLCPGEDLYFAGQHITDEGVYYDTLSTQLGCDSVVRMIVHLNPLPVTTEFADAQCYGSDYTDHGFDLSADSLAVLAQGWGMSDDLVLVLDRYEDNVFGCVDTTRLTLTLHPSFDVVEQVDICAMDLPYVFRNIPFYHDTTAVFRYNTSADCDSTYTLQLSVKPITEQDDQLYSGWNWYSTYIDQSNGQGLARLEDALNGHGRMIKSQTDYVTYNPQYNSWDGSLEELTNESMYFVQMDDVAANIYDVDVEGCVADPDSIPLYSGWNWLGFPMTDTVYLNQLAPAVSGGPSDGDLMKSYSEFSIYSSQANTWYGTLSMLTPGFGYMYLSQDANTKQLYYPNHSRAQGVSVDVPETYWTSRQHQFADNITFVGAILLDGKEIESDTLEVGVFCQGENRGSGRAIYMEGLNRYRVFITAHGQEGETFDFRLYDHERGRERRVVCGQTVDFHANSNYGSLQNPYFFRFNTDYDMLITAEICEGDSYIDHGFHVSTEGTYFKELTTAHGGDSIVRLDLKVNPVFHVEEEVVAMDFPFVYQGVTFDNPGTYVLPFQTASQCDSVWEVTVVPYEGLRELLISPVPAKKGQVVKLFYPFNNAEQRDLVVEVFTITGNLVQHEKPTSFPIELKPFVAAGTYMVKIKMGTGEVITGSIIVM